MAKKCYVSESGVARKIKQPYIGMGTYNLTEKFIEMPYLITNGSNYVDTAITIDASSIHRIRIVMDVKFLND